jgi:hypothetical protein
MEQDALQEHMDIFSINPDTGDKYTPTEAFHFFISNLKSSRILTDSSKYSIRIVLELNDEVKSPYLFYKYNTGTNKIDIQNVNKILLKISFSGTGSRTGSITGSKTGSRTEISIKHVKDTKQKSYDNDDLFREVSTQLYIYKKSYIDKLNFLDPICPAIYCYCKNLDKTIKDSLTEKILDTLESRPEKDIDEEKEIVEQVFSESISILTMMYLDCEILANYNNDENAYKAYRNYAIFELFKLYLLGYTHGDFHDANIVITQDDYLNIGHTSNLRPGRAYIIDFGRTYKHTFINFEQMTLPQQIFTIIYIETLKLKDTSMVYSLEIAEAVSSFIQIRESIHEQFFEKNETKLGGVDFTRFVEVLDSTNSPNGRPLDKPIAFADKNIIESRLKKLANQLEEDAKKLELEKLKIEYDKIADEDIKNEKLKDDDEYANKYLNLEEFLEEHKYQEEPEYKYLEEPEELEKYKYLEEPENKGKSMKTIRSVEINLETIKLLLSNIYKLNVLQFDLNTEGKNNKGGMKKYKRIVNKLKTKKKRKCLNKTKKNRKCLNKTKKNKILTVK